MAEAFRKAIGSGRQAYLAGLGRVLDKGGSASSPLTGFWRINISWIIHIMKSVLIIWNIWKAWRFCQKAP